MTAYLKQLEQKSIFILREARVRFKKLAILWSMGKDSTTSLELCRQAFFGQIPFSAIHIDSGHSFPESYQFREMLTKKWGFQLLIAKAKPTSDKISGTTEGLNKAQALKKILDQKKFQALIVSIRQDEHGIRAKERYFSPRDKKFRWNFKNQPPEIECGISDFKDASHIRIHPLLHWTELAVWQYIQAKNIPVNPLYFAMGGHRYRSIGYQETTTPIRSEARTVKEIIQELKTSSTSERAGRAQDKEQEYVMQRLRALGYM